MDFTFGKEHEMARKLFADFTENEVNRLLLKQMKPNNSQEKP